MKARSTAGRSVLADAAHSLGTSGALIVIGFGLNVLLARWLGPTNKGRYDLFVATAALLMMTFGFSLPSGITYVVARFKPSARRLVLVISAIGAAQLTVSLLVLTLASKTALGKTLLPFGGRQVVLLASVFALLTILGSSWRALLVGRNEIVKSNYLGLASRLMDGAALLTALIVALVLRSAGLELALYAIVASAVVSNVLYLVAIARDRESASRAESGIGRIVSYSAPCYAGNLLQFLNYRLDVFLVSYFLGQTQVGLYVLAAALAQLLWLPSQAVSTVLLPKVAHDSGLYRAERAAQATRLVFWLTLGVGIVAAGCAQVGLPLIYGRAFAPSVPAFLWLLPGIAAIGPAFILSAYIAGIGKPGVNARISFLSLIVTVVLCPLLVHSLGIVGAALASTASYGVTAVLTLLAFSSESGLRPKTVLVPTADDLAAVRTRMRSANGPLPRFFRIAGSSS